MAPRAVLVMIPQIMAKHMIGHRREFGSASDTQEAVRARRMTRQLILPDGEGKEKGASCLVKRVDVEEEREEA